MHILEYQNVFCDFITIEVIRAHNGLPQEIVSIPPGGFRQRLSVKVP